MRQLTVSLVQMAPRLGDIEANLRKVEEMAGEAARAGGELVCFPELCLTGYHPDLMGERWYDLAEPLDGPIVARLAEVAARCRVAMILGFPERGQRPREVYNAAAVIDADGRVLGSYAKLHAFGSEGRWFERGRQYPVFDVAGAKVGVMICYDAGFPEVARILALRGAELVVVPAAWIERDEDLWQLNLPSRALDNLIFVAGVNRIGQEGDLKFIGRSQVISPRGHLLAQAGKGTEEILTHTLDLEDKSRVRSQVGYWRDRRPEIYGAISEEVPQ